MSDDIHPVIDGWAYRPGKISVRKVTGDDGCAKIQMRLDLGLMQMNPTGRPDGKRPHGYETLLDYYLKRLKSHEQEHRSDIGFELSACDCAELRDEALMYYHRYVSCFILHEYEQVIDDTQRNLCMFDLCNRYAAARSDRMMLEQYRPYVIMMNTRAKAHLAADAGDYARALKHLKTGLETIKKVYEDTDQPEDFKDSLEAMILRHLARKFRRNLPADPVKVLERQLRRAVQRESFEDAARLRDKIAKIKTLKAKITDEKSAHRL